MKNKENSFDFNNLIIFEIANNHQGSVEHGKRIIKEMAICANEAAVRGAVKFQFRDLDTFIHPEYAKDLNNKAVQRFQSTRLSQGQFAELVREAKDLGLITIATPFDEASVDLAEKLGIEIIKVASCSSNDWPLLEKIAKSGKPVICSIGGLSIKDIDKVVSFFESRSVVFALLHCVGVYPSEIYEINLNQIDMLKNRFPQLTIGFSTHEHPDSILPIAIAYAKGARIFEKHVGVPTEKIKLNDYSANPEQVRRWLKSYKDAVALCGSQGPRIVSEKEVTNLRTFMRGVFAKTDICKGQHIPVESVFFAFPLSADQLTPAQFREGLIANRDYRENEKLDEEMVRYVAPTKKEIVYWSIHSVRGMLNEARIPIGYDFDIELSHHYGLERFRETGCTIIECIKHDEYAKKIIVQLPGQHHPVHYHKNKDETFQVLHGSVTILIENKFEKVLMPGDTLRVPRGVWHGFWSDGGVIFEEVSTSVNGSGGESFYMDKNITQMARHERKTRLHNWGRHQFDN